MVRHLLVRMMMTRRIVMAELLGGVKVMEG